MTLPLLQGGQRRRAVYGRTKAEVVGKLNQLKVESASGLLADPKQETLGSYMKAWLRDVQKERVLATTFALQEGFFRNHIEASAVAGVRLDRLRADHIDLLLAGMRESGASGRLRQQVYGLLRVALGNAVKRRRIALNPVVVATRPRAQRPEVRALSASDAAKLLHATEDDRLRALYVLALTTGMRQGELFGLRWGDVDLARGVVTVRRTQREVCGRIELGEPKTAKSRRAIALGEFTRTVLREHRKSFGAVPMSTARVFTTREGGPLRKSNFIRRQWGPLVERAGLAPIGFHAATRHTMASLALTENLHPKIVQERLGHSRIDTTLDLYSHTGSELQRQVAETLDAALVAALSDDSFDDNRGAQRGILADRPAS